MILRYWCSNFNRNIALLPSEQICKIKVFLTDQGKNFSLLSSGIKSDKMLIFLIFSLAEVENDNLTSPLENQTTTEITDISNSVNSTEVNDEKEILEDNVNSTLNLTNTDDDDIQIDPDLENDAVSEDFDSKVLEALKENSTLPKPTPKPRVKQKYLLEEGIEVMQPEPEENESDDFEISLNLPLKPGDDPSSNNSKPQKIIFFNSSKIAVGQVVCSGPNTRKGKKGFCECVEGFEHGDPSSRYGCYHCNQKCHIKAECTYPGKCACKNGMVGDGVKTCLIPAPHLLKVDLLLVQAIGGENITVTYYTASNYTQEYGYCKFGSTVVKGKILNDGELICPVPPSSKRGLKLSMSFDSETWSENSIIIMYHQRSSWISIIIKLLCFFCGLGGIIFYIFKRQKIVINPEIDIKGEETPFHLSKQTYQDDFSADL